MQAELEFILNNRQNIRSNSPSDGVKFKQVPQNDYDANFQLQQILEEKERYKQIILDGSMNRGRFKSAMRMQSSTKKGPLSMNRNMMKSVKSNYKASELEINKS